MAPGILKTQLASELGLEGKRQPTMPGALSTSPTHAQGPTPFSMKAEHSKYDLNGADLKTLPEFYVNPEKGVDYSVYKNM